MIKRASVSGCAHRVTGYISTGDVKLCYAMSCLCHVYAMLCRTQLLVMGERVATIQGWEMRGWCQPGGAAKEGGGGRQGDVGRGAVARFGIQVTGWQGDTLRRVY